MILGSNRNGSHDLFKQRLDSDVAEPFVVAPGTQYTASCDQRRSVGPVHRRTARETHSDHARTAYRRSARTVGDVPTRCRAVCAIARFTVVVCLSNAVRRLIHRLMVFALDPIRGKQQELTRLPYSRCRRGPHTRRRTLRLHHARGVGDSESHSNRVLSRRAVARHRGEKRCPARVT